ncbi:unnamed protein product [Didymodactylos carnosus]|uniref:MULE transposase domain-containing protein n=1 Tax=Didymodactylos carnosus TaxID=1234261 RepID=A0A8S2E748_9BILA|nr:unnamed protein product [Didymodactylos carnosus]CAF3942669.1 unnamed protein product [Didymodactylos carnosus]
MKKVMKVLHPDLFIDSKIKSAVEYKQQQNRCRIKFIEELYSWCSQRNTYPSVDKTHDVFVPYFEAVDVNNTFICLTTRQLLSTCKYSSVLYIGCTYKVTANELPLLVFGTSDFNRRFYPMGVCLISSDESSETFKTFFRGIQVWASTINNQAYTVSHVMGDGAAGITGAMCELPLARRLMCWAHVIRKVRGHGTLIKNKDKFLLVEQDIMQLQLSFSDQIFVTAANLMINKWKLDKELEKFTDYFEQQWLTVLSFWYEGACILTPSTNNGLESLNGRIKQHYTMRHKLPLSAFLQTAERMVKDWSIQNEQTPFGTHITYKDDLDLEAVEWVKKVDKTQILQLTTFNFVVPSKDQKINTSTWVNLLHSMAWDSYDHFKDWLHSARLLDFSRFLPPIFCTCRYGLKEFACVHAVGMMMLWGTRQMPQEIGKRRGKGRPKKVKYALSKD